VSRQTISTITDTVVEGMVEWQHRPLDPVDPVIFIDAIHVKIRDGKVANRPIYVALAVTCEGRRDIRGLWAGDPAAAGRGASGRPVPPGVRVSRMAGAAARTAATRAGSRKVAKNSGAISRTVPAARPAAGTSSPIRACRPSSCSA
jgi:hypothetical protein